jgi:hypothetical protein
MATGLLNAGGMALKWLFGVSTQTDLEKLNEKLYEVSTSQSEVVALIKQQASSLNESLRETKKITKII